MNKELLNLLKKKYYMPLAIVVIAAAIVYFVGFMDGAPVPKVFDNHSTQKQLISEIAQKKGTLERILQDNQRKSEASKKATVKEFYKLSNSGDLINDFSPLFENIITMIKQNGIRMKSIKYTATPEGDNLIKNGGGAYNGSKVDFELVGYYPQFNSFLSDLDQYPYFISITKFEIQPYQYDKRILIGNVSITFYSKR